VAFHQVHDCCLSRWATADHAIATGWAEPTSSTADVAGLPPPSFLSVLGGSLTSA
jgi:hypothetical protein